MKKLSIALAILAFAHITVLPVSLEKATELAHTVALVTESSDTDTLNVENRLIAAFEKAWLPDFLFEFKVHNIIKNGLQVTDQEISFAKSIIREKKLQKNRSSNQEIQKQIADDEAYARQLQNELNGTLTETDKTMKLSKDLQNKNFFYKEVEDQIGVSCGYHTAFNLQSTQLLFEKNQTITSDKIKTLTSQYMNRLLKTNNTFEFLLPDRSQPEMLKLGRICGIKNFVTVAYNQNIDKVYASDLDNLTISETTEMLNSDNTLRIYNLINHINTIGKGTIAFACNSGYHWTAFIIVKEINKNPYVIHMNSMNSPINQGSVTEKFAQYVLQFIA